MRKSRRFRYLPAAALGIALAASSPAFAQADEPLVPLVVEAGSPLRVSLDRRLIIKRVGQPVTATLTEPVYAYDRIVLPAGTKAIGQVAAIDPISKKTRLRAILGGNFTPSRRVSLRFDKLVLPDARQIPIQTSKTEGAGRVVLRLAGESKKQGIVGRAAEEAARQAKESAAVVTAPGKMERLKDMAIDALPYHPQFIGKGTVYSARLLVPLEFGSAVPMERASPGTAPAPDSILAARLVTPLGSATSPPGTHVEALLTRPVFSADQRLLLPAGTRLTGAVTFARSARSFRRNGQLRFLFERVEAPDRPAQTLLASLYSVEANEAARVSVDEEGGTTSTNSKARFAAPALAALSLVGTMHGRLDYDTDGAGPEMEYGGVASSTAGGFLGLGFFGIGLNQLGRPFVIATTAVGLARTVYSTAFAKGRDMSFPADTPIQVQLAPGPRVAER